MVKNAEKPRVRFAPSPTGPFHIGSARTALFNWLFAKKEGGVFILRIEDTDKERSDPKYEANIIEGLAWLGLSYDEGPYRQSERGSLYKQYLEKLLAEKKAYYCYCTKEDLALEREGLIAQGLPPRYSGHCRSLSAPPQGKSPQLIRLKTPEAKVEFKDIVRGKVEFDASLFGDQPLAKNFEAPLYNFAVVVDDEDMNITHVIRGEDHLSNTPKQILIQKALGFHEPLYAHIPLILNPDRSKMSKRYSDTSLESYREEGYVPQAVFNFLALLGWHPTDNTEIFNQEDLVGVFDLKRVQKAGAIFNQEKLEWLNGQHLLRMEAEEVLPLLIPFMKNLGLTFSEEMLLKIIEIEKNRSKTLKSFAESAAFFFKLPSYEKELLAWKSETISKTKEILIQIKDCIADIDEALSREKTLKALEGMLVKEGKGQVLWPLRVALSGQAASPDPILIMEILGKQEVLRRLETAIEKININA